MNGEKKIKTEKNAAPRKRGGVLPFQDLERSAGVLLNIASLPSEFAIGGLGGEALQFAESIKRGGFFWWQILPATAAGLGNSPYSGMSAFAGNYLYIDPFRLAEDGLISFEDADAAKRHGAKYAVAYDEAKLTKKALLKKAFSAFEDKTAIRDFKSRHGWVKDYALFMAIKERDGRPWWQWEKGLKYRQQQALGKFESENKDVADYFVFEQFIFEKQFEKMKAEVNALGVGIIGDMPIYPALDSADVWSNKNIFQLDEDLMPKKVAGVPPDYFAEDGQLWGNPLYDWAACEAEGFSWWISRFERMQELYDCVRIDHFRGLDRYWAVPQGAETAKSGQWQKAFGAKMLSAVRAKLKNLRLIAEDLGTLDDGVTALLKDTGLPGMKVMQFAFTDGDSLHLPHNYNTDCVAYTGTHDNDTTLGWYYSLDRSTQDYVRHYAECEGWDGRGGADCALTKAMAKTLLKSSAKLAVIPYQDLCGFGSDCRTNTPGVPEGNWTFRATLQSLSQIDLDFFAKINTLYGRMRPAVK